MFSPQIKASDKNPGALSVWFSSLRRKPKNERNATATASQDKKLQKSCIDLSETSKFYTSLDETALDASKEQLIKCGADESHDGFNKATSLPPPDVSPTHSSTASSSMSSFTDRSGGLCSNCCQFSTLSKHSEIKLINNKDEVRLLTDAKPNGDKVYCYRNRQNIKKVTTTTITRTTVINKQNRIGFIYASGDSDDAAAAHSTSLAGHPELRQLLAAAAGATTTPSTTSNALNTGNNNTQSTQSLITLPSYRNNSNYHNKESKHNNIKSKNEEATLASQQQLLIKSKQHFNNKQSSTLTTNTTAATNSGAIDSPSSISDKIRRINLLDDSTLEFIDSGNGSEIFGDRECTHLSCKHCKCKNQFKSAPELYFQQNKEVSITDPICNSMLSPKRFQPFFKIISFHQTANQRRTNRSGGRNRNPRISR